MLCSIHFSTICTQHQQLALLEKKRSWVQVTWPSELCLQIFSLLSDSPWETNDVLSCCSLPCSQTVEVETYNAGKLMSMQTTGDRETQNDRNESREVKSDMCHLVMSCIQASRVTVAVVTAWVRGWHQRYKLSDRLWKGLIPPSHCSLVNAVIQPATGLTFVNLT